MDYRKFITNTFDRIKQKGKFDSEIRIPVYNDDGEFIAFLRPITKHWKITYSKLAPLLGGWRRANPSLSASEFNITEQNTTHWLDSLIVGRPDRILFLIADKYDNLIGHMGYSSFDFDTEEAEIDCVLRGVESSIPGIMEYCLKTLLAWGKNELQLSKIYLSVGKTNPRAIRFYEKCGFKQLYEIPLYRRELENEIRWDEDPNRDPKEAEKFAIKMIYEEKT